MHGGNVNRSFREARLPFSTPSARKERVPGSNEALSGGRELWRGGTKSQAPPPGGTLSASCSFTRSRESASAGLQLLRHSTASIDHRIMDEEVCRICGATVAIWELRSASSGGGCTHCEGSPLCASCGHRRSEHFGVFGGSNRHGCKVKIWTFESPTVSRCRYCRISQLVVVARRCVVARETF
jgi:ribosomal protein L40E